MTRTPHALWVPAFQRLRWRRPAHGTRRASAPAHTGLTAPPTTARPASAPPPRPPQVGPPRPARPPRLAAAPPLPASGGAAGAALPARPGLAEQVSSVPRRQPEVALQVLTFWPPGHRLALPGRRLWSSRRLRSPSKARAPALHSRPGGGAATRPGRVLPAFARPAAAAMSRGPEECRLTESTTG